MHVENKVSWAIEPHRCALLIHDMQTHYLSMAPATARNEVIANAGRVAKACITHDVPIFASQAPAAHDIRERGLMLEMWGKGPSPLGAELDQGLGLDTGVVRQLMKRSYSAFYANDFEVMLRRLERDCLIIVGVFTSIGCHSSAMDAFMRDIRVFAVADAMADFNAQDHEAGLTSMSRLCARVIDSDFVSVSLNTTRF